MADSGNGGKLLVDIGPLEEYGKYLTDSKAALDTLLESLKTSFSAVSNAWKDKNGTELVTGFNAFIDKAKPLCDELESLGKYVTTESGKYKTALDKAKNSLSG